MANSPADVFCFCLFFALNYTFLVFCILQSLQKVMKEIFLFLPGGARPGSPCMTLETGGGPEKEKHMMDQSISLLHPAQNKLQHEI